jgi:hypothetical protein
MPKAWAFPLEVVCIAIVLTFSIECSSNSYIDAGTWIIEVSLNYRLVSKVSGSVRHHS